MDYGAADSIEQIERLKARDDDGNFELVGQRRILPITHDAAYVPGGKKGLHLVLRRTHDGFDRGRDKNMGDEQREILQSAPLGQVHAHGIGRRGGFKSDSEEDDLLVRILDGQFHRIERRVDHANVATARL